jgi:hypothetical protein
MKEGHERLIVENIDQIWSDMKKAISEFFDKLQGVDR